MRVPLFVEVEVKEGASTHQNGDGRCRSGNHAFQELETAMMASAEEVGVMIVLLTLVIVLAHSRQQIVVYFPSSHSRCSPDRGGVQRSGSVSFD